MLARTKQFFFSYRALLRQMTFQCSPLLSALLWGRLVGLSAFVILSASAPVYAAEATAVNGACTTGWHRADWDTIFQCVSSKWKRAAYWLGAAQSDTGTALSCTGHAGLLQWTGTSFQKCDGTSWSDLGSGSGACATVAAGSHLFTTSGTFTPPDGVSASCPLFVRVLMIGGGGGGGSNPAGAYYGGAGAGGSGYLAALNASITTPVSVVVGSGGAGAAAGGGTGTTGSSSSFLTWTAPGGVGGNQQSTPWGGYGGDGGGGGGSGGNGNTCGPTAGGAGGILGASGSSVTGSCTAYGGHFYNFSGVVTSNSIMGLVFQQATFSAGTAGAAGAVYGYAGSGGAGYGGGGGGQGGSTVSSSAYAAGGGGGGGGLLINGSGTSGSAGVVNGAGGAGASGVVYVEWDERAGNSSLTCSQTGTAHVYSYTGAGQSFTVPDNVYRITAKLWGAGGGAGGYYGVGGAGGYAYAILSVTPGQTLNLIVGGAGQYGCAATGAFGGGGTGANYAGCGGGRSAIQVSTEDILTAGGGGGGGDDLNGTQMIGGAGGGTSGSIGNSTYSGQGGTQTAGGAGGGNSGNAGSKYLGGSSSTTTCLASGGGINTYCGSGGGGYYGGGGGTTLVTNKTWTSGGGGSGYYSPTYTAACPSVALLQAGSGTTPANNTDPDYASGIGIPGGNGAIVLYY